MANVKISQLPSIAGSATTWNDVVSEVDSSNTTTSKLTFKDLFKNGTISISDTTTTQSNAFLASGVDSNSPTLGGLIQGNSYGNAIIAGNGKITDANSSAIIGALEAAGSNATYINNGSQQFIAGAFRSYISGGERNAVIATEDGHVSNAYNGVIIGGSNCNVNNGPAVIAGSQACTTYGGRNFVGGSEAMTINSNMSAVISSYGGTLNGNLYQVAIGSYTPTINSLGGAAENGIHLGTRESIVDNQRASMISTSGRTSLYDGTAHVDNLYTFGRIQSATEISTTVANVQTLYGGEGMIQYTDVAAGNMNLQIDDVRNGEAYHWVIDNTSGGSISVNSTATNTGFTITDNTAGTMSTGPHTLHIVVINDKIIIEGTH